MSLSLPGISATKFSCYPETPSTWKPIVEDAVEKKRAARLL
jgi:hypothetical protein